MKSAVRKAGKFLYESEYIILAKGQEIEMTFLSRYKMVDWYCNEETYFTYFFEYEGKKAHMNSMSRNFDSQVKKLSQGSRVILKRTNTGDAVVYPIQTTAEDPKTNTSKDENFRTKST